MTSSYLEQPARSKAEMRASIKQRIADKKWLRDICSSSQARRRLADDIVDLRRALDALGEG